MKISILIPVYNEFLTLPLVVQRVLTAPVPEGCEKEVIIIDDGSTDGTTELLGQYHDSPLVVVQHSPVNFGKGAALRIGIARATGDILLVQDGDLEYDPRDYPKILAPIVRGEVKIVYGSRFHAGARTGIRDMKWANWLANRWLTWTANLLYGAHLTDEATAYKAFAREVIEAVDLTVSGLNSARKSPPRPRRLELRISRSADFLQPAGHSGGQEDPLAGWRPGTVDAHQVPDRSHCRFRPARAGRKTQ